MRPTTGAPGESVPRSARPLAAGRRALGLVAVVAPWHLNKGEGRDTAIRMMDSRAFRTATRSVLLVVAEPAAGPSHGMLALDKSNAGSLDVPAQRFKINAAEYTVDEGGLPILASCGVVEWLGELEVDGRAAARALLAPHMQRDRETDPRLWLVGYLTEQGEMPSGLIKDAGKVAGYSRAGVERAAQAIPVVVRTGGFPKRSYWRLAGQSPRQSPHQFYARVTEATEVIGADELDKPRTADTDRTDFDLAGDDQLVQSPQSPQVQSPQSPQSPGRSESEVTGEATGHTPPACAVCGVVTPVLVDLGDGAGFRCCDHPSLNGVKRS